MVKVDYDSRARILNIKLNNNKIVDTDIQKCCVFDYDKDGTVVNIEVLDFDIEKLAKSAKKSPRE